MFEVCGVCVREWEWGLVSNSDNLVPYWKFREFTQAEQRGVLSCLLTFYTSVMVGMGVGVQVKSKYKVTRAGHFKTRGDGGRQEKERGGV